jgi:predicted MFS family arabinose efflux permease
LAGSTTELGIFVVFYGLDWIATVPPTVRLCSTVFGPERAGIVFGWVVAGHQLGAAFAAVAAGAIRTWTGSYNLAFWGAGFLCAAAALGVLTIRRGRTFEPVLAAA